MLRRRKARTPQQSNPVSGATSFDSRGESGTEALSGGHPLHPSTFPGGSPRHRAGGRLRVEHSRTGAGGTLGALSRDMDKRGVDAEVVYPTMLLSYLDGDVPLEVAICRSYNRYLAEAWKKAGDRLRWVVVPPLRDMEASVQEIETACDHGAVGVFFRGVEGDRSLAESYFFPVYEAANRLGMAVCIHTGAGAPDITKVFVTWPPKRTRTFPTCSPTSARTTSSWAPTTATRTSPVRTAWWR